MIRNLTRQTTPDATEHDEQAALIRVCRLHEPRHPELGMLYAIPNGGFRNKSTAARMAAEGTRAGAPDLCLPVPRHGYHSLYIELKRLRGGRLSEAQDNYLMGLHRHGHRVEVCHGWHAAWVVIAEYLGIEVTP